MAEDFREATITRQMPYPLTQVQAGDTVVVELSSAIWQICSNIPRISGTKRRRIPSNEQNATGG